MGKLPSFVVERDKEFYHWLITRVYEKTAAELYVVLPFVNEYGYRRNFFKESLFELDDSKNVQRLLDLIDGDKRFKFMHYGQAQKILMLLDKYCEFIEEKEKNDSPLETGDSETHEPEENRSDASNSEREETMVSKPESAVPVMPEPHRPAKKPGSVVIRTVNGTEYVGDIPAEALAALCEALAAQYPEIIKSLISRKVLSAGSTSGERIELKGVNSYIDRALKMESAMRFAKWLCESCEEADLPESIFVVQEGKEERTGPAGEERTAIGSSSRGWSKYEVALLIETYLKASENGLLKAAAEVLSHKLRDFAKINGKTIDASYRNVNGILMQLGTVQYCFTDGILQN